jgi:hypothetical protein
MPTNQRPTTASTHHTYPNPKHLMLLEEPKFGPSPFESANWH